MYKRQLEYCGLSGEVLSLSSLPHFRKLHLQLRSGKKLTVQLDQGLSYWEADRSEKSYMLKFDFATSRLGEEILEHIRCRVVAASDENTQVFLSVT